MDLERARRVLFGSEIEKKTEMDAWASIANNAVHSAVLFSAPATMMLRKSADPFIGRRYTLYQHIFGSSSEYPDGGVLYIGITARDWKKRWAEHRNAILRGSPLKFGPSGFAVGR
jgi:hypothetical protein